MSRTDYLREKREQLEDTFINKAEEGLNAGKGFDEIFQNDPEGIAFRLAAEWRERFSDMERRAQPLTSYGKRWSADGYRREVEQRRAAERQAESDERFYQSNYLKFRELAEQHITDPKEAGLDASMRPFLERASKELYGYVPEPEPTDPNDPFIMGFCN